MDKNTWGIIKDYAIILIQISIVLMLVDICDELKEIDQKLEYLIEERG